MNTIVLSDFHMCAGVDPKTNMTSRLEDFTNDHIFDSFLGWLEKRKEAPWHLIFAGDLFDYQQVTELPTLDEINRFNIPIHRSDLDKRKADAAGLPDKKIYRYDDFARAGIKDITDLWSLDSRIEGLATEEEAVLFKSQRILDGHPRFFRALARFLEKGNRVSVIRGNHDVELAWPSTQESIRKHCANLVNRETSSLQLQFYPHYYYESDRMYIEHGQQADGATALRHVYAPFMLTRTGGARVIELDFSSFLVRYLINRVEAINPLSDNIRPRNKYFTWVLREHTASAVWIVAAVLPKVYKLWKKFVTPVGIEEAARMQNEELIRLAGATGLPVEAARELETLKDPPTLPRGKKYVVLQIAKFAGIGLVGILLSILVISLYIVAGNAIYPPGPSGGGVLAYSLYLLTRSLYYIGVPVVLLTIFLNRKGRKKEKEKYGKEPVASGPAPHFRKYVSAIQTVLKKWNAAVPVIITGHTHYCDWYRVSPETIYYNTGSWMLVLNPEEQVFREKHTFSFVEITGDTSALFQFDPVLNSARNVTVEE
jgi:UDP-2,3-diacylglucosamine pyrophosphatase LpxH